MFRSSVWTLCTGYQTKSKVEVRRGRISFRCLTERKSETTTYLSFPFSDYTHSTVMRPLGAWGLKALVKRTMHTDFSQNNIPVINDLLHIIQHTAGNTARSTGEMTFSKKIKHLRMCKISVAWVFQAIRRPLFGDVHYKVILMSDDNDWVFKAIINMWRLECLFRLSSCTCNTKSLSLIIRHRLHYCRWVI